MSKIKQHQLSDTPCIYCDLLFPAERAKIFDYCKPCAESLKLDSKKELPIICLGKGAYQAYSVTDALRVLRQTNPKRTT
jgi:hypothetical protein